MASQIPRSFVDAFSKSINGLSTAAAEKLAERLALIDFSAGMTEAINATVALMQEICGLYADASSVLAMEFYEGARGYIVGGTYSGVAESKRVPEATEQAVRAIAQKAVDGNMESFRTQLFERVGYEVSRAAGECMMENVRRDPKRPKFARVPSGAETCQFCMMLASRGFVYSSKTSAGLLNHYHSNCDCVIVPQWGGSGVGGYDPDEWYKRWMDSMREEAAARAERNGTSESVELAKIKERYADASKASRKRKK